MNLHEYQAKELMFEDGLPVIPGILCHTPAEVEAAWDTINSEMVVVKAQVHAGGRGKGGGVKLAKSAEEAREVGEKMLGMTLITPQTGAEGKLVQKVYVVPACSIASEFYLSFLVDRSSKCISIIASAEGGVDIEQVAEETPEKIVNIQIDPRVGLQDFQCLKVGLAFEASSAQIRDLTEVLHGLYEFFVENDLSLLEVNPLIITEEGEWVILDAKCATDESALFRNPMLKHLRDYDEEDERDLQASKFGLSYVGLDGNIGCMVNGAGLAMGTMDIIEMYGGKPANFLDVGGGASKEVVTEAFKILVSDSNVKAILVNIFGGIVKCDLLANGVVEAAKEVGLSIPLIVRLQGTNVEQGRKILEESGLTITPAETMADAAEKVVAAAK